MTLPSSSPYKSEFTGLKRNSTPFYSSFNSENKEFSTKDCSPNNSFADPSEKLEKRLDEFTGLESLKTLVIEYPLV